MSAGAEDLSALLDNAYVRMILNNPDHHPAILDAMGLEVSEGRAVRPGRVVYVPPVPIHVPVLVVRPKGVTT